jgi:hypothetical protein
MESEGGRAGWAGRGCWALAGRVEKAGFDGSCGWFSAHDGDLGHPSGGCGSNKRDGSQEVGPEAISLDRSNHGFENQLTREGMAETKK